MGWSIWDAGGLEESGFEEGRVGVAGSVSGFRGRPAKASGAESLEKRDSKVE